MGKELLVASVLLVMVMFGMIFWKINEPVVMPSDANLNDGVPSSMMGMKDANVQQNTVIEHKTVEAVAELNLSDVENNTSAVVEHSPVAFGFMRQGSSYQIVGLLSTLDKKEALMTYVKQFCKSHICNIDVGYQSDIQDVNWQKDVVGILKLFTSGAIESGSLFIQANTLKLEGSPRTQQSKKQLQYYLAQLKQSGLEIENHITGDDVVQTLHEDYEKKKTATTILTEQNSTSAQKVVTTETVKSEKESTSETKAVSEVVPVSKPALNIPKRSDVVKKVVVDKTQTKKEKAPVRVKMFSAAPKTKQSTYKEVTSKEIKQYTVKTVKKVIKRQEPVKDIIAPSYMETSIDLARKIRSGVKKDDMEKNSRDTDDIVAKPKLEILR